MSLNLRQIEVFRAIMIAGSISGAARFLSVSQPAISRLIAYTEDRLQIRLFERVKGRVRPTPEAKRLFAEVDKVHQSVLRVNEVAEELRTRGVGSVRLVASPSVGHALVPAAIMAFRTRHPDVRVEFEVLTLSELVEKVGSNRADLGVSVLPVNDRPVVATPISEGRLVVICRGEHPLAALKSVRVADLAGHTLVGYGPQTPYGLAVQRALSGAREPPRVATQVRFTPNACALVQAGIGVAVVDEFVVMGRAWPDIVARPLIPKTPMRVHLLSPRFEPLSHVARALAEEVRALLPAISDMGTQKEERQTSA